MMICCDPRALSFGECDTELPHLNSWTVTLSTGRVHHLFYMWRGVYSLPSLSQFYGVLTVP